MINYYDFWEVCVFCYGLKLVGYIDFNKRPIVIDIEFRGKKTKNHQRCVL